MFHFAFDLMRNLCDHRVNAECIFDLTYDGTLDNALQNMDESPTEMDQVVQQIYAKTPFAIPQVFYTFVYTYALYV